MMPSRIRPVALAALGLTTATLLVASLIGVALSVESKDPGRLARVSGAAAVAKVAAISGLDPKALAASETVDGVVSRALTVRGPGVEAVVDVATGEVGYVTFFRRVPTTKATSVAEPRALQVAQQFVSDHGIDVAGLTSKFERLDHLDFIEYRITWSTRMNGALVPDQRVISINPDTGEVYALVNIRRAYAAPPTPTITAAEATDIAAKTVDGPVRLESADLVIRFSDVGKQLLVWNVTFREGDPEGFVKGRHIVVDALTGEVLPD